MQTKAQPLFLANASLITAAGANLPMNHAAVHGDVKAYEASEWEKSEDDAIIMANVPDAVFDDFAEQMDHGAYYSEHQDRLTKLAVIAARDCVQDNIATEISEALIWTLPEPKKDLKPFPLDVLKPNLKTHANMDAERHLFKTVATGRSAGIYAVDLAYRMLCDLNIESLLIGGADSYFNPPIVQKFMSEGRLLSEESHQGFACGEGAAFLCLTRNPALALEKNGYVIALHTPGFAEEPGAFYNEEPNRGEGLDHAFKNALRAVPEHSIDHLYTSMNGEQYWAKELGIATLRNQAFFHSDIDTTHPSACYGDLGCIAGLALLAISAFELLNQPNAHRHLIYTSADGPSRAALCLEKTSIIDI